ncbi:UDP-N-acetylmuramate--L-alanine ligase [Candidatus Kuenenbacteria bacterium RIFCSPLOWO2_12_FULL_42_13]|uniref:UDP-N-acetylmuramate--L-alanine ligase n=1 Tax=Candidatus Kuenenbacteria bacterium RIFCSPLOWO2_12_FULL_42_13 TaxID=1798565 RepID=A0A1F6FZC8_9BACT|nr:MAG: UDP-N-acetylmuramate--L-alanine ligase [Candidatus Kuenenbacteria bacterium RIFCSPLOWO2_12_FULL_42_13]
MEIDFEKINKVYFIGIGGIMMSAAAKYFLAGKKQVFGSDRSKGALIFELRKMGAKIAVGHQAGNIKKDFDLVIYTQAIAADNPELKKARQLQIKTLTIYQLLGVLAKEKKTITVSGMHGKSTTTAMIGLIMEVAGFDPTVFVGTKVKEWQSNFRLGELKYLLSEACEYKDNFLNFRPDIAVLTNLEAEHLDYFKNLAGVKKSFWKFISQIKKGGYLLANADDRNLQELLKKFSGRKLTFGLKDKADFSAEEIRHKQGGVVEFRLKVLKKAYKSFHEQKFGLKVPGEFNIYNALGAVTAGAVLGVKPKTVRKVLAEFDGVWRRFELKGKAEGVEIYDDYGHHPTEIKATLNAAGEKFKGRKWWVVFQPHLYSRTRDFLAEFAEALNLAPNLMVAEIYPAREKNVYHISSRDVVNLINKKYRRESPALFFKTFSEIIGYLKKNLKPGEVVMTLGAGEADKVGEGLLSTKNTENTKTLKHIKH